MRWLSKSLWLVLVVVLTAIILSAQSQSLKHQEQKAPANSEQQARKDERGTDKSPLAIKLLNTGKSESESAQEAERIQAEYDAEWWMRVLTAALVGVGLLQLAAFVIQARRLKETIGVMHDTAERQLRAYLFVATGGVIFQDRVNDIKFQPNLVLKNAGQTPAYEVSYCARADVLPFPLNEDEFDYSLPNIPVTSAGMLGPDQQFILSAVVPESYSDEAVRDIKFGEPKRVYVWGVVTYIDAFKRDRYVKFCQSFYWLRNGNVMGVNTRRHNDAN